MIVYNTVDRNMFWVLYIFSYLNSRLTVFFIKGRILYTVEDIARKKNVLMLFILFLIIE